MKTDDAGNQKGSKAAFDLSSEAVIGGKTYIVERHFAGARDYRQAIFAAVENEANREMAVKLIAQKPA